MADKEEKDSISEADPSLKRDYPWATEESAAKKDKVRTDKREEHGREKSR